MFRLRGISKQHYYSGPIKVIRQRKNGLYECLSDTGVTLLIAKHSMRPNICDCECHIPGRSIMHFVECCDLCYIKEDCDVQLLIDNDISESCQQTHY